MVGLTGDQQMEQTLLKHSKQPMEGNAQRNECYGGQIPVETVVLDQNLYIRVCMFQSLGPVIFPGITRE